MAYFQWLFSGFYSGIVVVLMFCTVLGSKVHSRNGHIEVGGCFMVLGSRFIITP